MSCCVVGRLGVNFLKRLPFFVDLFVFQFLVNFFVFGFDCSVFSFLF